MYAALTRQVARLRHKGEWRAFAVYYHDGRDIGKVDNRAAAVRNADRTYLRIGTFGEPYLHSADMTAGIFDAAFWGVLQTGRWGGLDHSAKLARSRGGMAAEICPETPAVAARRILAIQRR